MIERELLPSLWNVVPLRRVLRKVERPVPDGSGIVTAYRSGKVTLRSATREEGYTLSEAETGYQGVERGDLVFHALDGFAGAVGVSDAVGRCTPVYHVCEPFLDDDPRFIAYSLRAMGLTGFLAVQAGNVRQRSVDFRAWDAFAQIPFPRPPISRQRTIADSLDAETARIDSLIEKKRQLAATLEEWFVSRIAYELGVDTRVAPSNWEAAVSATWPTVPLRRYARIVNGGTPSVQEDFWNGNVVWVTPEDLSDDRFEIGRSRRTLTALGVASSSATVIPTGSIVISTRAPIGSLGIAEVPIAFNQGCRGIRPSSALDSWFLLFQLMLARPYLDSLGNGTTFKELSAPSLGAAEIAVPPLPQQVEIRGRLMAAHRVTSEGRARLSRQIELLREHRQALITGAVTGQLDIEKAAV